MLGSKQKASSYAKEQFRPVEHRDGGDVGSTPTSLASDFEATNSNSRKEISMSKSSFRGTEHLEPRTEAGRDTFTERVSPCCRETLQKQPDERFFCGNCSRIFFRSELARLFRPKKLELQVLGQD